MSSPDGQLPWHGGVDWMYVGHLWVQLAWKIWSRHDFHFVSPSDSGGT